MCLACAAAALTSPGIEPPSMFSTFMALATMPDGQPHLGLQVALLAALPEEVDSRCVECLYGIVIPDSRQCSSHHILCFVLILWA